MRIHSRIAAALGAVALVGGFAAVAVPAQATVAHAGDCAAGARAITKISPGLLPAPASGPSPTNTISGKGLDADPAGSKTAPIANEGSCTFATGSANAGTHTVSKWGVKLVGSSACASSGPPAPPDPATLPPTGKIQWSFTDSTPSTQAYITLTGFVTGSSNKVNTFGIVSKGAAVGSFVTGQSAFLPVAKAKANDALTIYSDTNNGGKDIYDLDTGDACLDPTGHAGVPITQVLTMSGDSFAGTNACTGTPLSGGSSCSTSFDVGSVSLS